MAEVEETQISQSNYKETAYADQSWEVIGEFEEHLQFYPLEVPIIDRASIMTDPMFADFGGVATDKNEKRFHLPEGVKATVKSKEQAQVLAAELEEKKRAELQREKDAVRAAAFEEGRKAGHAAGFAEAQLREADLKSKMQKIVNDLSVQYGERLQMLEKEAVKLSLALTDKIIGYAIEINPEYLTTIIGEALKLAGAAAVKRIRVSPQDYEFIQVVGLSGDLKESTENIPFERDEKVQSGCIIDSAAGEIDYRLDQAWERIRDQIIKAQV